MPRPAILVVVSGFFTLLACGNPFGGDPPPPSTPDLPLPVPAETARTERTGPVDPAHMAVLRESEKGCNFFVSTQPGDGIAPITRLPGECPVWFEVAWDKGRMVMLADGVPMTLDDRQAVALPEPEHSSAIALRGEQILVCGSGDETWTEKDGKVVFTAAGKTYDAPKTAEATDYALARRYVWTGSAWKQESIGAVPVFPSMSDAACTALEGWPGGDRLDPSQARWGSGDWAPTGSADGQLLAGVDAGEWSIDPTGTVAVRGTWTGETFTAQGPVALWVAGAWKPIEGTRQGPLVFSLAPDWILYDVENGQSRLVSRRDGTETWADETDGPIFLWPADLALPAVREREAKRGDEGKARERQPRHGRPDGR
nr:hypothetical protein [Deltaproteobacteria bacterium]